MAFIHRAIHWIINNKLLTFLSLTSFIFFVCTVSLGTENTYLNDEVSYYRKANLTKQTNNNSTTRNQVLPTSETTVPTMSTEKPNKEGDWRLPKNTYKVEAYDLTLRPDLKTGLFSGTIKMQFSIDQLLESVKFNLNGLTITNADLRNMDGDQAGKTQLDKMLVENEIAKMKFDKSVGDSRPALVPGTYVLILDFKGDLKNRIVGFYRSSYTSQGKTRIQKLGRIHV